MALSKKQAKAISSAVNTIKVAMMMRADARAKGDDRMADLWMAAEYDADAILADLGIGNAMDWSAAVLRTSARALRRRHDKRDAA